MTLNGCGKESDPKMQQERLTTVLVLISKKLSSSLLSVLGGGEGNTEDNQIFNCSPYTVIHI